MQTPQIPTDEAQRLAKLRSLQILDTPASARFDRITRLATHLLSVPVALVSLVDQDRQWFKSRVGLDASETSRDISFCGHVVANDAPLLVHDAAADPRFIGNPLVTSDPQIRFYAGYPLRLGPTSPLGAFCVIGFEPRTLDATEARLLEDLADLVVDELRAIELSRTVDSLAASTERLEAQAVDGALVPICSYCKHVRDPDDTWEPIERYVHREFGATFTHGICRPCYDTVRAATPRHDEA